jgi:hypothetical protein
MTSSVPNPTLLNLPPQRLAAALGRGSLGLMGRGRGLRKQMMISKLFATFLNCKYNRVNLANL